MNHDIKRIYQYLCSPRYKSQVEQHTATFYIYSTHIDLFTQSYYALSPIKLLASKTTE